MLQKLRQKLSSSDKDDLYFIWQEFSIKNIKSSWKELHSSSASLVLLFLIFLRRFPKNFT